MSLRPRPEPVPGVPAGTQVLICCLLLLATGLVYGRMLWDDHKFVLYDDHLYVIHNPDVQSGLSLRTIAHFFSPDTVVAANYHPLTMLSHALDCQLFGVDGVRFHHLHTLLWHAAATVLLFLLLARMTGQAWPSALVAALFSWHPLHVESVAWISERKDVLSAFFWFLTMWLYVSYVRRPSLARYLAVAVSLALGLLSKPMVVTLPCVLLLMDYWPLRRLPDYEAVAGGLREFLRRLGALALEKLPLFALVFAACVVTFLAQRKDQAVAPLDAVPMEARVVNVLMSYNAYIAKAIWPAVLCAPYPMDTRQLSVLQAWLGGIGLLLVLLIVFLLRRRYPYWFVGWLWYLGTMVPVIGIVHVGSASMADRYSYIPHVGVFMGVAFGLADLVQRFPRARQAVAGAAVAWLVILGLLCYRQVGYWKNTETLFAHTVAVTKRNHGAYVGLGTHYVGEQNYEKAASAFVKALMIGPTLGMARHDYGVVLRYVNRQEDALRQFRLAIKYKYEPAEMHLESATTLVMLNRYEDAIAEYKEMLKLDPNDIRAFAGLGGTYARQGDLDEAEKWYAKAAAADPDNVDVITGQAMLDLKQGRVDSAIKGFNRALVMKPNQSLVAVFLSRIYSMQPEDEYRNGQKALELAKQACAATQERNALALDTMAAAYAELRDFDHAREYARKASQRALHDNELDLAKAIERRYERYLTNRPCREDIGKFDIQEGL